MSIPVTVYPLWFVRPNDDREDTELLIGIYSSDAKARDAITRLRDKPGFRDYPQGFEVHPVVLDKDGWTEGYVTITHGG